MTVPAQPDDDEHSSVAAHPLPDYEPDAAGTPASAGWSSMRPATKPRQRLAPAAPAAGWPAVPPTALVRVVRHVLEVLDGRRPVAQLRALLPDAAFQAVLTRLRETGPGGRHVLRRVHTCYPTSEAVEACAVIDTRDRRNEARVMTAAVRFERHGDSWTCAAFRLLG